MPISITPPPPPESATRTSTNRLITLPKGTNTALIPLPTEAIDRTFQQGHDLVILLTDGHRITLADFFVLPDPALILRDPTTGDHTEIRLDEKGTIVDQRPRSRSELAERFTIAEFTELQTPETTRATTPETSTATATQITGSGTGWTTATRLGVLAGSATVLTALTTAARGTNGERPEGAANQTETETDSSDSSEGSGAGTETGTTETETDTQGGETGTEGDQEDTDAGMPTDQGTDTDEGTDEETSEETPDTDTDTHNPPQPVDPATHGDSDGEENASTDSDDSDRLDSDGTEGGSETSTATAGTNTNTDNADQQDSDQDNTNTAPAPPVDPNAETEGDSGIDQDGGGDESVDQGTEAEGANIEVDGAEGAGGTDSTDPEPDAGAAIDGPNPMPMPQPNSPGAVTLTGTATEDETLTATVTDTDGLPDGVDIRYQWQRNIGADSAFENIENATSPTYTLGDTDVGQTLRVLVNYIDGNNTAETVTSDATNAVTNINDAPTGAVIIDGTVEEDQTLTANITALQDADGLPTVADAFTYQWQRNTGANGGFENIAGETGNTHTLDDDDVGREVQVMVSYTDDGGEVETLTSALTTAVTNINDEPTGSVSIDGTATEDETLTANTDNLADADGLPTDTTGYRYQWQSNTGANGAFENIENATSQTYILGDNDVGREVQVMVSYTDDGGMDESLTSTSTAAVENVNDAPTGSVTITGTVEEDQILTANVDNVADEDGLGALSYQWQRSNGSGGFEAIENATGQTYTLGDDDVGREVRVQVNYTDANNTPESLTSDATNAVSNINDNPSGSVTIDGAAREDETLTANIGTLDDADGLGALSYQWQRSNGNGGFGAIENATSQTYILDDADVGREVRVEVRYTDGNNTDETLTSAPTTVVTNINDNPSGSVTIDGTVREDEKLTANVDNVADADGLDAFSYQWQRSNGGGFGAIENATGQNYTLGDEDVGSEVRVQVNYTDANNTPESLTSDATNAVSNINDDPSGSVSIDGMVREDETLTANVDNVTDADGLGAFSYQWQRSDGSGDFENIANATGETYTLGDDDVGRSVQVRVNYTDARGEDETVISDATAAVTNVNDAPTNAVTISGQATEDQTLTAQTDTLADDDGLGTLNYQWQRSNDSSFENIAGETGNTYTLGDTDVGQTLRVQVSYRDQRGADERLISDATLVVTNVNDEPTGSVSIDGTAEEDQILTANTGTLDDADGLGALSYQWRRNTGANDAFENIAGATGNAYTLDDADVGREVQVMVSYTDDGGMDERLTSAATAVVENVNDEPSGSVTIDGTVREDQRLTANITALQDADGLPTVADAFTYQWQRNTGANGGFENIENATSETYTLSDEDVGWEVQVTVNYTDARGEDETVISDATAAVGNVNDLPTGAITIDGTVRGDETLTANTGALADEDGLPDDVAGYNYQWQRSDGSGFEDVEDATGQTYTLGDDDVGREVRVQVSYTDGNNTSETLASLPTVAVGTANITPTGGVRIDGTVRQGQELSADTTAIQDADGLPDNAEGYRYQWQRTQADDTFADIENATEQTYTLIEADVGQRLQVVVRYTDGNDTDETLTAATVSPAASNADDPVIDEANTETDIAGDDFLRSEAGNQRLNGLGGDDVLVGGAGADILDGGDGTDSASYFNHPADIEINLETGTGKGGDAEGDVLISIEGILGGTGDDRLTGNNADNVISGTGGNDILNGAAGNDSLNGNSDDDRLDGGSGNDRLNGGFGDDILVGGRGNDLFRFEPFDGSDTITDFGTGDDRLQFELGLFADLEAVRTAARNTDDGNLEITLSETETLTLEGASLDSLTADSVTTLDREGNDTTTPPADANSASDAPAFELDDLAMDEEALMRLAASEGMALPPPEPQTAQAASEKQLPADQALALADPLGPPATLALFDADLEGYAGL